jgi:hypothetical protein
LASTTDYYLAEKGFYNDGRVRLDGRRSREGQPISEQGALVKFV